jgi:hypothetical protein
MNLYDAYRGGKARLSRSDSHVKSHQSSTMAEQEEVRRWPP